MTTHLSHRSSQLCRAIALLSGCGVISAAKEARTAGRNQGSLAAGVDSAYDDNVFNGRGADVVTRVAPHAAYQFTDPRLKLDLAYDLGYWIYAYKKAEDSLNHRAAFAMEARLTRRLMASIENEFVRAED